MRRDQGYFIFLLVLGIFLMATPSIKARPAPRFPNLNGVHWALLVAGSNGWGNYRHQADVCHAYHVLKDGGLDDDHIVVMMYDDIASSPYNPAPGTIINRPGGPDMYAGVPRDYTGSQVSAANFLAVLSGNASALTHGSKMTGNTKDASRADASGASADASRQHGPVGSGKVIASGPNDRVFVFYSDHGSPGILGMPIGQPFLMASDLMATLKDMSDRKAFKEMVMYVEACESGSMFEGLLPPDLNIYVATASNAEESSWATYCPGAGPVLPSGYDTCLGDLFSVAWMENSDALDLNMETLKQQFDLVRDRTSNNGTFAMGSHAKQYGTLEIDDEEVAEYLGDLNTGQGDGGLYPIDNGGSGDDDEDADEDAPINNNTDTNNVDSAARVLTRSSQHDALSVNSTGAAKGHADAFLDNYAATATRPTTSAGGANQPLGRSPIASHGDLDHSSINDHPHPRESAGGYPPVTGHPYPRASLGADPSVAGRPYSDHHGVQQRDAELLPLFHRYLAAREGSVAKREALRALDRELDERARVDDAMEELGAAVVAMASTFPSFLQLSGTDLHAARRKGQPLVDDWACFKQLLDDWQRKCGPLSAYGLRHSRVFANLCNAGVRGSHLAPILDGLELCGLGSGAAGRMGLQDPLRMPVDSF